MFSTINKRPMPNGYRVNQDVGIVKTLDKLMEDNFTLRSYRGDFQRYNAKTYVLIDDSSSTEMRDQGERIFTTMERDADADLRMYSALDPDQKISISFFNRAFDGSAGTSNLVEIKGTQSGRNALREMFRAETPSGTTPTIPRFKALVQDITSNTSWRERDHHIVIYTAGVNDPVTEESVKGLGSKQRNQAALRQLKQAMQSEIVDNPDRIARIAITFRLYTSDPGVTNIYREMDEMKVPGADRIAPKIDVILSESQEKRRNPLFQASPEHLRVRKYLGATNPDFQARTQAAAQQLRAAREAAAVAAARECCTIS